jgi:hypothetical protein
MGSNDNPLNNTKEYYPNTKSASRGALSTAMHKSPTKFGAEHEMDKQIHAQYSRVQPVAPTGNFVQIKGPQVVPKYQSILVQRFRKGLAERGGRSIIGL